MEDIQYSPMRIYKITNEKLDRVAELMREPGKKLPTKIDMVDWLVDDYLEKHK